MQVKKLQELIDSSSYIVFFGGAGTSTESNIPDFRSSSGIFNMKLNKNFTPEEVVSRSFFNRHTDEFFKFYRDKLVYPLAKPNNAHIALAELEKQGKLKCIITQNIDGLHQMAGSTNVLELHGSIHRNTCFSCRKEYDLSYILNCDSITPLCNVCGGVIKPDVVLYEEALDNNIISQAITHISRADLLIIGGTSLSVYPAASFIDYYEGDNVVVINKDDSVYQKRSNLTITRPIGQVLYEGILKKK